MVTAVKALQERGGWLLAVHLLRPVLIEAVDSVVVEHPVRCHEVVVEVTGVGQLPLCVVEQLVADIDQEVDAIHVGEVRIGPEVVGEVDLGLLGGGTVLAESGRRTFRGS